MDLLNKLKPNPDNPRIITKEQYQKLLSSLKELPKMLDIHKLAYDSSKDFIVYGGNQRLEGLKELAKQGFEIKDSWFVDIAGWTPDEIQRFIIADNVAFGSWNYDILTNTFDAVDLKEWGLDPTEWDKPELSDEYSQKLGEVLYDPKKTNWKISDLFQRETKFDKDIEAIQNPELKEMLKARLAYFHDYNYSKIADYYAYQATPEEQKILEKLAFVLLDKDKLIENGFSKIIDSIEGENQDET